MKSIFICVAIVAMFALQSVGQTFTVAPAHLVSDYDLSDKLDNQVQQKLQKALMKNGVGSVPYVSRFAVVPTVIINNEVVTATVPQFYDVEMELVFSMCDVQTGRVYGTTSVETQCRGTNRENALTKGVAAMKYDRDPTFVEFIANSKQAIFDYYEQNLSTILNNAKQAANNHNYAQANFIIAEIPSGIPSYDTKVMPLLEEYAQKAIDDIAGKLLDQAKAAWAASPNAGGAEKVAEILMDMPPGSSYTKEIQSLIIKVEKDVKSIDKREWDLHVQQLNNEHIENMAWIEASRDAAVAWGENQPKETAKIYLWY